MSAVPESPPGVITLKENHIGQIAIPVQCHSKSHREEIAKFFSAAMKYRDYIAKHQPHMLFDVMHVQCGDVLLLLSTSPDCNKKLKEVQF